MSNRTEATGYAPRGYEARSDAARSDSDAADTIAQRDSRSNIRPGHNPNNTHGHVTRDTRVAQVFEGRAEVPTGYEDKKTKEIRNEIQRRIVELREKITNPETADDTDHNLRSIQTLVKLAQSHDEKLLSNRSSITPSDPLITPHLDDKLNKELCDKLHDMFNRKEISNNVMWTYLDAIGTVKDEMDAFMEKHHIVPDKSVPHKSESADNPEVAPKLRPSS